MPPVTRCRAARESASACARAAQMAIRAQSRRVARCGRVQTQAEAPRQLLRAHAEARVRSKRARGARCARCARCNNDGARGEAAFAAAFLAVFRRSAADAATTYARYFCRAMRTRVTFMLLSMLCIFDDYLFSSFIILSMLYFRCRFFERHHAYFRRFFIDADAECRKRGVAARREAMLEAQEFYHHGATRYARDARICASAIFSCHLHALL